MPLSVHLLSKTSSPLRRFRAEVPFLVTAPFYLYGLSPSFLADLSLLGLCPTLI
jgi:hypothetical protein